MKITIDDRLIYEHGRKHGQTIYAPEILSDMGFKVASELGILLSNLVYNLTEVIKITFISRPFVSDDCIRFDIRFQIVINLFEEPQASKKVESTAIWNLDVNELQFKESKISLGKKQADRTDPKVVAGILKKAIIDKLREESADLDQKRIKVDKLIASIL